MSDNQVIVFTDWPGRSPQEAEDQVTYPLVTNLQGLAGVRVVRASSAFSFSMVNVIFEDDVELYWARTRVLERLNLVAAQLPEGVTPTLGPDATGVGQVFWYTLESDRHSLRDLRTLQDWFVRYRLNSVPGVAEVASVGGYVQQYQVDVDPNRLRAYKLPLSVVVEAVERSNTNVGGNVVEQAGQWAVVRGIGLIESTADVENIVLGAQNGTPVYVKNVAEVKLGNAFRTGALDRDGKEAVGGVVIARYGVNTLAVIEAVKRRLKELEPGLPAGVRVVPFYDRTQLIERATGTLKRAFIEELLLVTLAHIIFLAHFRSILIVTIPLPLAVLVSFLFMKYMGISSNLMSLSGIAIAIGVLVDAGIVVTENAFRFIEQRGIDPQDRPAVRGAVLDSTRLVGRPVFFSMAIIILAFVPVFALTGQEGKLFHPLAFTKTFAMVGATIIAVTLVPVLCTILLGGKFHAEQSNPVMRLLGGKGAGLADMTRAGLPVPPGFIVTTEACNAYYTDGKNFPEGMWEQVIDGLRAVEAKTGKKFGDPENPLLVSVRSGAPSSMPGMMDTVLNLGLNEQTVQGLATQTGDLRFSLDAYRRFATLFAEIVMGVAHEKFGNSSTRSRAMS
ncbi:MAG: copper/silver efflux system protein [Acidobacteriota bacterium]|nr:copper/silver efflux system protein [Acidobacteriota bacterium]